jgi:DNA-binding transcriptional MerR regulator
MNSPLDLHSPKHVAQALGVSESSLKRWCDRGLIQTTRTAGGHRKLLTGDVIRFARERGMSLITPELLGLPPAGSVKEVHLNQSASLLAESILVGNESLSRQIVLNLAFGEHALARVFDDVIAQAFVKIGELWECHQADVYQERRGCEIIRKVLAEIGKSQTTTPGSLTACGGTATGNAYSLQTQMAEIVLRDCGFQATSLGTSIPFESLVRAVYEVRPTLFWLSAAYIADEDEFLRGFGALTSACAQAPCVLVLGGRALSPTLREQLVDANFCDNMQQLAGLARTLIRVHQRSQAAGSQNSAKKRKSQRSGE